MTWLAQALVRQPEIVVLLTIGLGAVLGRVHHRSIAVGAVTGTLLVGVAFGALVTAPGADGAPVHVAVGGPLKSLFFLLFLFALGFRLGPQFVAGLRGTGLPQAVFAVVLAVVGFAVTIGVALVLGYNPGLAAGLAAGGLTQSAIIGVAQGSIAGLPQAPETIAAWTDLVPVAYAVTYIFGTVGTAVFIANVAPRMLGIGRDLPAAAAALSRRLGVDEPNPDVVSAHMDVTRRAYRVWTLPPGVSTARQLEEHLEAADGSGHRVYVARVRAGGPPADAGPDTALHDGDTLALTARRMDLFAPHLTALADEVDDHELLDFPIEDLWVVVTSGKVAGETIGQLRNDPDSRRVYVRGLRRSGHDMPWSDSTRIHSGDELHVQGPLPLLEHSIAHTGYAERRTPEASLSTIGIGVAVGALVGVPAVTLGTIPVSLSTSVGALLAGLLIGWYRSRRPVFGRIPTATNWFLETAGLNFFIAVVGISAGPGFVSGLADYGLSLLLAGAAVTIVPLVVMTLLARYVFRFDPVITLGVLCGARSATAAVGATREAARSAVPLLGYTVPYAVANIVLTVGGAVVVAALA